MNPVLLSICCPRVRIPIRDIFAFFSFFCGLVFAFHLHSLLDWATAAALKLEAAVDGNKMEVADRGASFPARLGSGEPENYAARSFPLRYEYDYLYGSTWKCGELELCFPHPPEDEKKQTKLVDLFCLVLFSL